MRRTKVIAIDSARRRAGDEHRHGATQALVRLAHEQDVFVAGVVVSQRHVEQGCSLLLHACGTPSGRRGRLQRRNDLLYAVEALVHFAVRVYGASEAEVREAVQVGLTKD